MQASISATPVVSMPATLALEIDHTFMGRNIDAQWRSLESGLGHRATLLEMSRAAKRLWHNCNNESKERRRDIGDKEWIQEEDSRMACYLYRNRLAVAHT